MEDRGLIPEDHSMDLVDPDMISLDLEVEILLTEVIDHKIKTYRVILDAGVTHVTRQRELVKRLKSYFKKSQMLRWLTK